ncbi:ABC transporter permease [Brachybacterium sp. YJGR34]|uniref:ABC transporter permease n=1 Tax=Brachybacterium sp. YJGR34 TaxID=2059911 RepID=UPI000E0A2F42|nr:polyketide antibiotic transporter [Brachybacterium sp. YJGR34]
MSTAHPRTAQPSHPTHRADAPASSSLTGLGSQIRLYGRLTRRAVIIWTLSILVLVPASIVAMEDVYPDQNTLDARAMLLDNPSAVMMTGPYFAADHYTFWAMVANELFLYILLPAAIMSILLITRLTRAEEEAGRLEMTRALATGRLAAPAAALIIVGLANLALGLAVAVGTIATGGAVPDSLALGLGTTLTGMVFAAIAAVTAQLTEHAGTASGMALGVLAIAFMVRGIGDVMDRQGSWLSWFSPLAWAQQTRVYVDLRWWPLLVSLGVTVVLLVLAGALSRRRDVGAGLRAAAAGPGTAAAALLRPGGLGRRLLSSTMLAWGIGLLFFAIAFGSLASSLDDFVAETPELTAWAPVSLDDLTGSFSAFVLTMLALGPIALAVSGMLRLRTEELAGRLAGVLLAGTSRTSVTASWAVVVLMETAVMMVLLGLGTGLGVWAATDETRWIGELTAGSLVYLPAIALYGAIALFLYGLSVRATGLAWLLVVYSTLVTVLGDMLGLPDWAKDLSPLQHVPMVPSEDLEAAPLVLMGAAAVVLAGAGLLLLRRRDLAAG